VKIPRLLTTTGSQIHWVYGQSRLARNHMASLLALPDCHPILSPLMWMGHYLAESGVVILDFSSDWMVPPRDLLELVSGRWTYLKQVVITSDLPPWEIYTVSDSKEFLKRKKQINILEVQSMDHTRVLWQEYLDQKRNIWPNDIKVVVDLTIE